MKISNVIIAFLFFAHTVSLNAAIREWKDIDGKLFYAEYVSHTDSEVTMQVDGTSYVAKIDRLSQKDKDYIQSQKSPSQPTASKPSVSQKSSIPQPYVSQKPSLFNPPQTTEMQMHFEDPEGDLLFNRTETHMDLVSATLKPDSGEKVHVSLQFAEPIPKRKKYSREFTIWLKMDLDNDTETGQQEGHLGTEMAIALKGWKTGNDWTTYNISKSPTTDKKDIKVTKLRAKGDTLSFTLQGSPFKKSQMYAMNIITSAGSGTVDSFLIRPWFPYNAYPNVLQNSF